MDRIRNTYQRGIIREINGEDIWTFHSMGYWVVVTVNGTIKNNGESVLGRGIARQCKLKYPEFPKFLGEHTLKNGNTVKFWSRYKIITLPVKHDFWEMADLELINPRVDDVAV